jgi:hypothetical protein
MTHAHGTAELETFTVIYDRDGVASHGAVIARMGTGERVLARLPGENTAGIVRLTDLSQSPIGARGTIQQKTDELNWVFG